MRHNLYWRIIQTQKSVLKKCTYFTKKWVFLQKNIILGKIGTKLAINFFTHAMSFWINRYTVWEYVKVNFFLFYYSSRKLSLCDRTIISLLKKKSIFWSKVSFSCQGFVTWSRLNQLVAIDWRCNASNYASKFVPKFFMTWIKFT